MHAWESTRCRRAETCHPAHAPGVRLQPAAAQAPRVGHGAQALHGFRHARRVLGTAANPRLVPHARLEFAAGRPDVLVGRVFGHVRPVRRLREAATGHVAALHVWHRRAVPVRVRAAASGVQGRHAARAHARGQVPVPGGSGARAGVGRAGVQHGPRVDGEARIAGVGPHRLAVRRGAHCVAVAQQQNLGRGNNLPPGHRAGCGPKRRWRASWGCRG